MTIHAKKNNGDNKVKSITFDRGEFGRKEYKTSFDSLCTAMGEMSKIARQNDPGIGYIKIHFTVTFKDDYEYFGRFDLKGHGRNCEHRDIIEQIQKEWEYIFINPSGELSDKESKNAEIFLRKIFEYNDEDFETLKSERYA